MARVWTTTLVGAISILNGDDGALAYAGLTGMHAEAGAHPGTTIDAILIYSGEGTTGNLLASFALGGSGSRCFCGVSPNGGPTMYGASEGWHSTNVKIVATSTAIALMNPDANGVSKIGVLLTKDMAASTTDASKRVVGLTPTSAGANLASPAVVPVDPLYSSVVNYSATTSLAFGCTTLAKIPAPSFDGTARYLDTVLFAHAAQYAVDGAVTLNNIRYYSIGGAWLLRDIEEE